MPKVVGVKFKKSCRVYYFEALDFAYTENIPVIVETARGTEMGYVCMLPTEMDEDKIVAPLKPVVRLATEKDVQQIKNLEQKREEALKISAQKIAESELDMKLTDCEYTFDGSKLIIYFTADGRVDFRDLVKDLASAFHVRIELRQIGARDECKMLGGLGPCGRACCCANHMPDYAHVTIKMAKNQGLSLNPTKISGLCGRLMCCLSYEDEVYSEINKRLPSVGQTVRTNGKEGVVVSLNHLKETLRVKVQDGDKISFLDVQLAELDQADSALLNGSNAHLDNEINVDELPAEEKDEIVNDEKQSLERKNDNEKKFDKKDKNRFKKKNNNQNNNQNGQNDTERNGKNNPNANQNSKNNVKDGQKNEQNKPNQSPENKNASDKGEKPYHKRKKKRFHKPNNQGAKPESSSLSN